MIIFGIATALLLAGLIAAALLMKRQNTAADLTQREADIVELLDDVYKLGGQQKQNLLALCQTVQQYADDETKMFTQVTASARELGELKDPKRLHDAARTAHEALHSIYIVAAYYPPLLVARDYLAEEEAANNCEAALYKSIERYNSAAAAYNTILAMKPKPGSKPLTLIAS